ncbi:MAG: sterol desaturase family protein [Kiritimatiellae bacterium]|nr:sterol desaturase family protein [Kiritimatiellia bacterium]
METIFNLIEGNRRWISIGVLVLLLSWESIIPFFSFFRHQVKQHALHGLKNTILGLINLTMISLGFVTVWLWAAEFAHEKQIGLFYWIRLPPWLHAVCVILLFDFWTYWWHRMNHRIPFFWKFHRVHHSNLHMDVTTANRSHFGEIFFSSVFRIPLILLLGAKLWHLALYESFLFPVVQIHHANIGLPKGIDKLMRIFIVTPEMHKVHHSRVEQETDSNYTSLLSVWDRLFGSFMLKKDSRSTKLGLEGFDQHQKQTLLGLLKTPVKK